jgi:hypothetical protein
MIVYLSVFIHHNNMQITIITRGKFRQSYILNNYLKEKLNLI